MSTLPLTLNAVEVRWLQEHGKLQLRRPVKDVPWLPHPPKCEWLYNVIGKEKERWGFWEHGLGYESPFGGPGDERWVQESWWDCIDNNDKVHYVADGPAPTTDRRHYEKRSPILLGRRNSRLSIVVGDVRVQAMGKATLADIRAEGICGDTYPDELGCTGEDPHSARIYFIKRWDARYPKHPSDANPLTWLAMVKVKE